MKGKVTGRAIKLLRKSSNSFYLRNLYADHLIFALIKLSPAVDHVLMIFLNGPAGTNRRCVHLSFFSIIFVYSKIPWKGRGIKPVFDFKERIVSISFFQQKFSVSATPSIIYNFL